MEKCVEFEGPIRLRGGEGRTREAGGGQGQWEARFRRSGRVLRRVLEVGLGMSDLVLSKNGSFEMRVLKRAELF